MLFFSLRRFRNSLLSIPANAVRVLKNELNPEKVTAPSCSNIIQMAQAQQQPCADGAVFDTRKCHSQG